MVRATREQTCSHIGPILMQLEIGSVAFSFLRCGGLGVRETGRDVEGGAWPKKFGNRCTSG